MNGLVPLTGGGKSVRLILVAHCWNLEFFIQYLSDCRVIYFLFGLVGTPEPASDNENNIHTLRTFHRREWVAFVFKSPYVAEVVSKAVWLYEMVQI